MDDMSEDELESIWLQLKKEKLPRYHTFGNSKACEILDRLLENNPASRSVSRFLNQYRTECIAISKMENKSVASGILVRLKPFWSSLIDTKFWNDEIKHYTHNVMVSIFREALRKTKKHNP